ITFAHSRVPAGKLLVYRHQQALPKAINLRILRPQSIPDVPNGKQFLSAQHNALVANKLSESRKQKDFDGHNILIGRNRRGKRQGKNSQSRLRVTDTAKSSMKC